MIRIYKKGDYIFNSGEAAANLYKISKGIVVLGNISPNGKSFFKQFICNEEVFGEEVIIEKSERMGYALAFTDVEVEVVPVFELSANESLLKEAFSNVLKTGQRAYDTLERTTLSAEEKLMSMLKRIGELMGVKLLNGEVLIQRHIKHKEFAFLCSCSRQCITELLINFQKKGLLKIDRQSILLSEELV